jgi:hypothetical protein
MPPQTGPNVSSREVVSEISNRRGSNASLHRMDDDQPHSNVYPLRGSEPIRGGGSVQVDGLDKSSSRWFLNPSYRPCPEHDIVIGDYCFRFRPEYERYFIERGLEGLSLVSISAELGVPFPVIKHWATKIKSLAVALELAYQNAQFKWENIGRANIVDKSFNAMGWLRMMAIQFPGSWRDDQTPVVSPDGDGAQADPFGLSDARDQRTAEQSAELVLQRLLRLKKDTESA